MPKNAKIILYDKNVQKSGQKIELCMTKLNAGKARKYGIFRAFDNFV